MATMISNSERQYKIVFIESDGFDIQSISLSHLLQMSDLAGADYEWKYAISESIDHVLDLKKYDKMTFQSSRDNPNSLAIILRVK